MPFGQLIIGPPGSGKSTYCEGMQQFLALLDRPTAIVNLDAANDRTKYTPALDVRDLVTLDEIMDAEALGPNGGILYALEELEHNFDWFEAELKKLTHDYILFDCPGQVELFTHHSSLRNIVWRLQKMGYSLIVMHLLDSFSLSTPSLYISTLLLSLRSMLQLDLPHLNVLTKVDNLNMHPLPLPLEFYTDAQGLADLLPHLDEEMSHSALALPDTAAAPAPSSRQLPPAPDNKFSALNRAIVDLVEEYALVSFELLCVEDRDSMAQLLQSIDRASGYAYSAGRDGGVRSEDVWRMAVREPARMEARDVEERWVTRREEMDEAERKKRQEEAVAAGGDAARNGGSQGLGVEAGDLNGLDEEERAMMAQMRMAGGPGVEVRRVGERR